MTRRPFNANEAELPRDLEPTVADLERYLADSAADPTADFADRVMGKVTSQPAPRRGLWAVLAGTWAGDRGRMALLAATVAAAILAVVVAGQLPGILRSVGGSPEPSVAVPTMEPSPTFTITPEPTEPATESDEPSPSPSNDEDQTPGASDDGDRTPRPSASPTGSDDHSGPGGGGGDDGGGNSGPGGGGSSPQASDDSGGHSGPSGGSGSSGSGSSGSGSSGSGSDD